MCSRHARAQLPKDLALVVEETAAAVGGWIDTQMEFHHQASLKE